MSQAGKLIESFIFEVRRRSSRPSDYDRLGIENGEIRAVWDVNPYVTVIVVYDFDEEAELIQVLTKDGATSYATFKPLNSGSTLRLGDKVAGLLRSSRDEDSVRAVLDQQREFEELW